MKSREAFLKMCDRMGSDPDAVSRTVCGLAESGSAKFGAFRVVRHQSRDSGRRRLTMLSLYEGDRLVTKFWADVRCS